MRRRDRWLGLPEKALPSSSCARGTTAHHVNLDTQPAACRLYDKGRSIHARAVRIKSQRANTLARSLAKRTSSSSSSPPLSDSEVVDS